MKMVRADATLAYGRTGHRPSSTNWRQRRKKSFFNSLLFDDMVDRADAPWHYTLECYVREAAARRPLGKPLWLRGAAGVGKTHAVEAAARRHGVELTRIDEREGTVTQWLRLIDAAVRAPHTRLVLFDDADALLDNAAGAPRKFAELLYATLSARPLIVVSSADLGRSSVLMSWRKLAFTQYTLAPAPPTAIAVWLATSFGDVRAERLEAIARECGGDLRRAESAARMASIDARLAARRRVDALVDRAERLVVHALDDVVPHAVARRCVALAEDACARALDERAESRALAALIVRVRSLAASFDTASIEYIDAFDAVAPAALAAAGRGAAPTMNVFEACDVLLGVNRRLGRADNAAQIERALRCDSPAALERRIRSYSTQSIDELDVLARFLNALVDVNSCDPSWHVRAATSVVRRWRREHHFASSRSRNHYAGALLPDAPEKAKLRKLLTASKRVDVLWKSVPPVLKHTRPRDLDCIGYAKRLRTLETLAKCLL